MHPVASGGSGSTPLHVLHSALPICTHFSPSIAYLAPFEIYRAQALPHRRVGPNVSTSTQDCNSIPQQTPAIALGSSNVHPFVSSPLNRPSFAQSLKAVSTIERQVNVCEFNVVVPNSQSLGNQSDDGGTSLENGNLRASVGRLERNLESWESRNKGNTSRVPDAFRPCNSTLFDSPYRRRLLASAIGGGDGRLGGVKELPVQRWVEFEGSAKVDFH